MKVSVERAGQEIHFRCENHNGYSIEMGTAPKNGGRGGVSPMEGLLMSLASCSGIDILMILEKGRQQVDAFKADVEADREPGKVPALFTAIRVHYQFEGDLDPRRVERAVKLSLEKYCSVARILENTAPITSTYSINGISFG